MPLTITFAGALALIKLSSLNYFCLARHVVTVANHQLDHHRIPVWYWDHSRSLMFVSGLEQLLHKKVATAVHHVLQCLYRYEDEFDRLLFI